MEGINADEINCDTCLIIQEILSDEIEDEEFLEFAMENLDELLSYIGTGNLNIRIHKDITGEMWFGVRNNPFYYASLLASNFSL